MKGSSLETASKKSFRFFLKVTNKFIPVERDYKVKQVTLQVQEKFTLSYHSDQQLKMKASGKFEICNIFFLFLPYPSRMSRDFDIIAIYNGR